MTLGLGLSATPAEAKKFDIKVKFCGLVGDESDFQQIELAPGTPNLKDVFPDANGYFRISSFNGNDKVRATARKIWRLARTGEIKTFPCNDKKGGCVFRILPFGKIPNTDSGSLEYRFNDNRDYVLFSTPEWYHTGRFNFSKDTELAIKITRLKAPAAAEKACSTLNDSNKSKCTYSLSDIKIETSVGLSCDAPNSATDIRLALDGRSFSRNQSWQTESGYRLVFQSDANLVLYRPDNSPAWATGCSGKGANKLALQSDGNVVLYANGAVVWATGTEGRGKTFAIQNDGNLVVYDASGNALWKSDTDGGREGDRSAGRC